MYNLSLPVNQSIQKILHQELIQNKEKEIEELEYLDAVIMEGLRLWPPIPMTQPRVVPKGGIMIDGWWLGEGVVVGAQSWSVQRLNANVSPDGDVFRPGRWLDMQKRREMEKSFLGFGMGGRGCTGRL
jgi:cytochrome P450